MWCAISVRRWAKRHRRICLWILPIPVRGFGQGSRNNIDDFESQGFIERVDEATWTSTSIRSTARSSICHPSSVRWTAEWLESSDRCAMG